MSVLKERQSSIIFALGLDGPVCYCSVDVVKTEKLVIDFFFELPRFDAMFSYLVRGWRGGEGWRENGERYTMLFRSLYGHKKRNRTSIIISP